MPAETNATAGSATAAVTRRSAADDSTRQLRICRPDYAPLEGVAAHEISAGAAILPRDLGTMLGESDAGGVLRLRSTASTPHMRLAFCRPGYVTRILLARDANPDEVVILEPEAAVRFRVIDTLGAPSPDFGIGLSISDARSRSAVASCSPGQSVTFVGSGTEGSHVGITDSEGNVEFRVSRGVYSPELNLSRAPLAVVNGRECVSVHAPGETVQVVVTNPVGIALRIEGDEVLCRRIFATKGTQIARGANAKLRLQARQHLEDRFPDCTVLAEIPSGSEREQGAQLHYFGRTTGWGFRDLRLRSLGDIRAPERIDLLAGARDLSGWIQVEVMDASGQSLVLQPHELLMVFETGNGACAFDLATGRSLVPSGDFTIRQSPSGPGRIPDQSVEVMAGSEVRVSVTLPDVARRFRLAFQTPGGGRPGRGSFEYSSASLGSRVRTISEGNVVETWFTGDVVTYTARFAGFDPVHGEIRLDPSSDANTVTDMTITLQPSDR